MLKMTLDVEGMMCGMCEAHVSDALRGAFPDIKKVKASHSKGQVEFLSEYEIPSAKLHAAIDPTGYELGAITCAPAKKGLFGWS